MLDASQALTDQSRVAPRWARYAIPLAGAWSLLYGVLGGFWALGGRGLPFGQEGDPGAELSILGQVEGRGVGLWIAALGLTGALMALAMYRSNGAGRAGRFALAAFAWFAALTLSLLLPDYRLLVAVAYTPIMIVGAPFGWPEGISLLDAYPWPTVNQFIVLAGGLSWGAAALAYQRKVSDARLSRWTTPDAAARWGRWAVTVAVVIPLLYAATRWAWALGIPLGITEEFLREGQQTGLWIRGAALATMGVGGAVLTLGLVQRWGEVFPRWMPRLAGRRVPPRLAIIPAALVSVLVTIAGVMFVRLQVTGYFEDGVFAGNWAATAPELLWPAWGAALAAATLAYHYRRRGRAASGSRSLVADADQPHSEDVHHDPEGRDDGDPEGDADLVAADRQRKA